MDHGTTGPTPLLDFVKRYVRLSLILGTIIFLVIGIALIWEGFDRRDQFLHYILTEIGKAIVLTTFVSTIINWYFRRQLSIVEKESKALEKAAQEKQESYEKEKDQLFRQTVNTQLDTLRHEILRQTKGIAEQAVCFDALQAADVDRFYQTRDEASKGVRDALLQRGVSTIKLIGISLNDFMRDENQDLHEAWVGIRECIEKDLPPRDAEKMDIRVLIIDPCSEGANLRARAEGIKGAASRLNADVRDTMRDLYDLERKTREAEFPRRVSFATRVYRTSPNMFLAWTPHIAFVQSYYFRPRHTRGHYPTIKFHNSGKAECIHQELGFHFDWIWDNASTSVDEHINMHHIGVAEAIRDANIVNIYYDFSESRARIIKLIEQTKESLWIKGISLHSYFTYANADLIEAVIRAYERNVDIKILLINPNSEQAKLRSFREYLMSHPTSQLDHFDDRARRGERLFTDTTSSINFIKMQLRSRIQNRDLGVRLYSSGPECFTLLTDEAALVEQYHYGKVQAAAQTGLILGGDMPITEYKKIPSETIADRKKDPYLLFKNSFKYVYDHCSIGLDEYQDIPM